MNMPHTVAELSASEPIFFSVQPLPSIGSAIRAGSLPSLGAILADPAAEIVGVRAHDIERAGRPLPSPSRDTVGQHVLLSATPRTLAAFASSRPGNPSATYFERRQIAVVCLSLEHLTRCGRNVLYHARSILRIVSPGVV